MQRRSSGSSEDSADTSARASPVIGDSQSSDPAPSARHANQPRQSERQRNTPSRSSYARSRTSSSQLNWHLSQGQDGAPKGSGASTAIIPGEAVAADEKTAAWKSRSRRLQRRSPWSISLLTLFTSLTGITLLLSVLYSSAKLHCDSKGCRMSWMSPSFMSFDEFDTEHTRFASKYSLHLYREQGFDNGPKVKGIPVLFIPGNAGSYKQVRSIASESSRYFHEVLQHDSAILEAGVKNLDFFSVDFNEDFTAFHGQTMLDQAEYVNEAIRYILSLYLDPQKSVRDPSLPDPSSVIILGHSMGGIVARTAFIMPNYQPNSINTIVTMSAPHARPPVTFDSLIVKIYQDINEHWRRAFSKKSTAENPLAQVTLVSIAGGGLDTVVPSDYASLESIVPDTHGFTVFTSTIPNVWTSMDHQAITWCDQFRKVIVRTLYDVVDNHEKSQTKPRAERMRLFKRRLLTGLEQSTEKTLQATQPNTLLTVGDISNAISTQGERFVLRHLGTSRKPKAHLLPIPPSGSPKSKRFTLLSDNELDPSGGNGNLEVLVCSVYPLQTGQAVVPIAVDMDLSGGSIESTRLACKNAASDAVALPASTRATKQPFFLEGQQQIPPFSYLQYDYEDISDHQFVAIVDKTIAPSSGWVVAEFSDTSEAQLTRHVSVNQLMAFGLQLQLPSARPMVTEVRIPSIQSSLLAYNLEVESHVCREQRELFRPLIRQHIGEPHESKFFVNANHMEISLHGVSPYMPPPLKSSRNENGLSLQFWTDPTCDSVVSIKLSVDPMGSLGKLYMRYRTVFGSFPLLVMAMVLRKQFRVYDDTGVFVPFAESLDSCLRRSLPMLLLSMTFLSLSIGQSNSSEPRSFWLWKNSTSVVDFAQNDLLVGTTDPFFWFLIPLIGIICIGVCVVLHYAVLLLISLLSAVYGWAFARTVIGHDEKKRALSPKRVLPPVFSSSSPRRRLVTTAILLFLVSTFIPYQFAYVVACMVQLSTSVRAHRSAHETPSLANSNFTNYVHTVFLLMLWVLPINLPTLVVWLRNLTVQWFTPFSTHHNVLSILPFILLVETLTAGKMVPSVAGNFRHLTNVLLFGIAVYAAVYGVSYAYMLHHLVNIVAAWLVAIHSTSDSWALAGLSSFFDEDAANSRKQGKRP
ncbi:GPI inositol-deacylase [Xylariomycetidae sp. FL0641]|nr:GPI inositol-deacylase [Xylariomycetidae sp. FL0641]